MKRKSIIISISGYSLKKKEKELIKKEKPWGLILFRRNIKSIKQTKKFDGKKLRRLKISEIGQISGRAGRYLNDGYFGITGDCGEISAEEVELLENHKFDDIHTIYWRSTNLNFKNGNNLIKSLEERPNKTWLKRIPECEDEKVLKHILKDVEKLEIYLLVKLN